MTGALAWLEPGPGEPLRSAAAAAPGLPGACYDGLVHLTPGGSFTAVDLLAAPEGRAAALSGLVPRGAAVARSAAVWVHTGRLRPARAEVVVEPRRRVQAAVLVHRQHLSAGDVVPVGGVPTTTPLRTAVDLLCFAEEVIAIAGTRALLLHGLAAAAVEEALRGPVRRIPVRRARELLQHAETTPGGWCQ